MAVAEIIIERRQGREFALDGVVGQPLPVQMIAPGEDMRSGHLSQLHGAANAGTGEKLRDVPLIILPGVAVARIGEPLRFRGDGGQRRALSVGEAVRRDGSELGIHRGVRVCR